MPSGKEESSGRSRPRMGGNVEVLPRVEIPMFEGINPRAWVRRCVKYFMVNGTPENRRVEAASLFLGDVADLWFQGWLAKNDKLG